MTDTGKLKIKIAGGNTAGKTCSICQTVIVAGEHILYCPDCGLPFHHECWQENGGCSQYGCESAPRTKKQEQSPQLVSSAWGDEKQCPACGRKIKGRALKCRFCGAEFESRDIISKQEYSQREYAGKEYLAARNKVVAMFLASATGCLSPIMLILFAILIWAGSLAGVDYKRLPAPLRAVAIFGFGLNCMLSFLMLVFAIFD